MSQENRTEMEAERNPASTQAAAKIESLVTLRFETFDAFEDYLLDLLTEEFSSAEAHWLFRDAKIADLFNDYYVHPDRWNDIQGMALRNLICFSRAQSATFIAKLINAEIPLRS